jgi:enoyl-CoA hydratase/carnithine racemase
LNVEDRNEHQRVLCRGGHGNVGLLPGGGATARLPRWIGPSRSLDLLLTGRVATADDMERWGLVHRVTGDGDLTTVVGEPADTLARKSRPVLASTKTLVRVAHSEPSLAQALERELGAFARHLESSDDPTEGLTASAEKRTPHFGRATNKRTRSRSTGSRTTAGRRADRDGSR